MLKLSKLFPTTVFRLRGEGEESGDVWVKFFKNGKVQTEKLKVELPDFDADKLS